MKTFGLLVALTVAWMVVQPVLRAADVPAEGAAAPDFTLSSQDGSSVSLHSFKGQWVVLYFYPKDFTSGCTIEAHNFQRDIAQYNAKKVQILGVSVDTVDSHKQFGAKENVSFKLLADTTKDVVNAYGSLAPGSPVASRNTFLIDPNGVIRKVYLKVNPTPHSQELLAALSELQR